MQALVRIDHFTDPACPFAFSAEPALLALRWHYAEQLQWHTRLVVLSETPGENEAKGLTVEVIQTGDTLLAKLFGMPINTALRPQSLVALPADTAAKAAELRAPEVADGFLRALRVAWMSDHLPIDRPEAIAQVAKECGIDPAELASWSDEPQTHDALAADKRAARSPIAAATGPLDHKLAGPPGERRYTCPSLELSRIDAPEQRSAAPGIQNLLSYETLLANVAPELTRRPSATDPLEVLRWAKWPLATSEVAEVMGVERAEGEAALAETGATSDARGYWSAP